MTSAATETRILFNRRVAMRDGVELSADVYISRENFESAKRCPVILLRTPYVKANATTAETAAYFAKSGFAYVAMDVRGRGDSDGVFYPWANEGPDGYDAIEWCAQQSWSNGNIGTMGGSYPGTVQWQAAVLQPPHLKAMAVSVPQSDPFIENPAGVPSPMHACWSHYVSGRVDQPMEIVDWEQVYKHLPLQTMDERAGGRPLPWWRDEIEHPQLDEWWSPRCYQAQYNRVNVPVFHISGWYDDEEIGTPTNFAGMTKSAPAEARKRQRLLMGPWGHRINTTSKVGEIEFGRHALIDLNAEYARWFKRWLDDEATGIDTEPPVRIFVMGTNEWRDEHEWPLARTQFTRFYLHSGGKANSRYGDGTLSKDAPADEPADAYRYDPENPTPFVTDIVSNQIGGPDDYAAVQRRDDILVYVTDVLDEDIEVTGPVEVDLHASSSAKDTDFMAMLSDVWPNGFRQRLCDSMIRARFRDGMDKPSLITPGEIYKYTIRCWDTSHVFKRGHRICLALSSAAFPKFARNLNTGGHLGKETTGVVAEQTVHHNAQYPSAVILPVIPTK